MWRFSGLLLLVGSTVLAAELRLPKPWPTALEKFVKHDHTQIVKVQEAARFDDSGHTIILAGLVARNSRAHPSEMRGIWFSVRGHDTEDTVYLSIDRAHTLREQIDRLQWNPQHFSYTPKGGHLAVTSTEDCQPTQALPVMHTLCVGLYRRPDESGVTISTGYLELFLPGLELDEFVDSIDAALATIEA